MKQKTENLRRPRLMLAIVAFGLFMSGVTIWPGIWFFIDFAFAPGAAIPLLVAWHDVAIIEHARNAQVIATTR